MWAVRNCLWNTNALWTHLCIDSEPWKHWIPCKKKMVWLSQGKEFPQKLICGCSPESNKCLFAVFISFQTFNSPSSVLSRPHVFLCAAFKKDSVLLTVVFKNIFVYFRVLMSEDHRLLKVSELQQHSLNTVLQVFPGVWSQCGGITWRGSVV